MPPRKPKNTRQRRALHEENDALMREPEVLDVVPIGKTSWRRGVAEGRYPKPVRLSARVIAWRVGDIRALLASLR